MAYADVLVARAVDVTCCVSHSLTVSGWNCLTTADVHINANPACHVHFGIADIVAVKSQ